MRVHDFAQPYRGGHGPVSVLFCHGFTGTPWSLREWAKAVEEAGYRVSVPRLPGHGTTWQELAVTEWMDWYSCVEREFLALRAESEAVFIAGLSMGGALALRLAEQHPDDVAGLVLVNPAVSGTWQMQTTAVTRYLTATADGLGSDIARPEVTEHSYARTPLAAVHSMTRMWADVRARLDLIYCPVLLFRSPEDHVVPAASSDVVLRQVSSEDITEQLLLNSFHVATRDHDAPQVFAETIDFLARHTGP